jgi:FkbM family methyltransferase
MTTRLYAREILDRVHTDGVELVEAVARRALASRVPPERVRAAAQRLRPPRRHTMMPVLEQFAQLRPDAFFVQIGSHDGQQQDPLREIVLCHEWSGIMVEPVPYVFVRLQRHYDHLRRVRLENVAVGQEDGPKTFYHLRDAPDAGREGLPIWFDALGSFRREVVLAHRPFIPDIDERIVEIDVPCVTFDSLCARNGVERLDFLHTDTEGYDFEILKSVPFARFRPTLIVYESHHLDADEKQQCAAYLQGFDYKTIEYGLDTWCLNTSTLPRPEADLIAALWRWVTDPARAPRQLTATRALRRTARRVLRKQDGGAEFEGLFVLTESDRRYLITGYDDRVSLLPEARRYLSTDNPRLRELAEEYRGLKVPIVNEHTWSPKRLSAHDDLRYFRRDNLYLSHQGEHPRSMAMALFIYMRHLDSRRAAELLDLLPEDGAFGAWTVDVPGRGKLSRDRLDSASEILFLERELGILRRPGLRILDMGSGYGRLAHRMATAHRALGDYCCVGTVSASTFVSEYYLKFRRVSPPVRVASLAEVLAMEPDSFDLALNVTDFSQLTLAAIEWWLQQLARLRVRHLFLAPQESEGIVGRDANGRKRDAMPALRSAGYQLIAGESVITDPAVQELVRDYNDFYLLEFDSHRSGS